MKPVIPKVRVGDVLLGTKNLRSYIRTCSSVRYMKFLEHGTYRRAKEFPLYTPKKDDRFIVAVNNHDRFCVWGVNADVVLLFVNNPDKEMYPPRMNASIFAQWFRRTGGREPSMNSWPKHAYYLWACLQMNAWNNRETKLPANHVAGVDLESIPFIGATFMPRNVDTTTIKQAVLESIVSGTFRNLESYDRYGARVTRRPFPGNGSMGPDLQHLPALREELKRLLKNPRHAARARKEKGLDFSLLTPVK